MTDLLTSVSRSELQEKDYGDGLGVLLTAAQKLAQVDWEVASISNADGHTCACYVTALSRWVILETLDSADLALAMFYVTFQDARGKVTTVIVEAAV